MNRDMPEDKKKSLEFKGQGTGMWIGMILFSSVWMFVLGIFVGRGTAPVKFDIQKLQKELVALKETVVKEERERFKAYMETAQKRRTSLGFYEALKVPDEEAETQQPVAGKKPSVEDGLSVGREPATEAAAAAEGKNLTLQIASMRDIKAADAMVEKLKKQGYEAYRTTGHIPDRGVWYRVRVGFYRNKKEAESIINRMKADKHTPYLVRWQ